VRSHRIFAGVLFLAMGVGNVRAADGAPVSGFRADVLGNIDYAARELVQLADAVPADKYAWRPAPGVRSIAEVYMHVAVADYYIPSLIGVKVPDGVSRDMETKVTEKAQVVEALKKSIAHARAAIESTPDSELDTMVKVRGADMTKRGVFILLAGHIHEHLGQSIAYARINGITPPWSASEGAPPGKSSTN